MTQKNYSKNLNIFQYLTLIFFFIFLTLFITTIWFYPNIDHWLNAYPSRTYSTAKLSFNQRLYGDIIEEQNVVLARFLGIPYALPPKRFHRALPHPGWTGNREATKWPSNCYQKSLKQYEYLTVFYNEKVSEDCLYLNIWSPHKNLTGNRIDYKLLPVVVFIHGGAFRYMGVSMEAHEGSIYSALANVVFVAINYRGGVFGFPDADLSAPGYSKNIGLYDQEMALRWISKNIRAFGGDPEQITLQGQSAGAISAGLHMLSSRTNKLFQRTIMQSGSPMMAKQLFTGSGAFNEILQKTGCNKTNDHPSNTNDVEYDDDNESNENETEETYNQDDIEQLKCLEKIDPEILSDLQEDILKKNIMAFSPSIPSDFVSEFPAFDSHPKIYQKSVLIGADANETGLFLHYTFPNDYPLNDNFTIPNKTIAKTLNHYTGGSEMAKSITSTFLQQNSNGDKNGFFAFLNDFSFKGPVLKFTKFLEKRSTPTYLYLFSEQNKDYPKWVGASHWLEMDYVFGIPLRYPDRFTKIQQEFSRRMIANFAYFVRTGKTLPQLGVKWPEYSSEKNEHMILKADSASLGTGLDTMYYSLFDLSYDAS